MVIKERGCLPKISLWAQPWNDGDHISADTRALRQHLRPPDLETSAPRRLSAGEAGDDRGESIQVRLKDDVVGDAPPLSAQLEIFNHLVHGSDEHVGAL